MAKNKSSDSVPEWEIVVGIEIHLTLNTNTKLFSAAPVVFGAEANTNTTPVCMGMPGSIPVVNEAAVEQAIKMGLALGCDICDYSFDRKAYFYPDMPKNYQITQYDHPICRNGNVELASGIIVGIERAHLEEDAGKITYTEGSSGKQISEVDFNRAGNPLLEIVTLPEIHTSKDARDFVEEVQHIAQYSGASNALLEEGSIKADINISVRPLGSDELRTRIEVKNLNSLTSIARCIDYEAARQIEAYKNRREVKQETMEWLDSGKTQPMRGKEYEEDYGYFADPDLPPFKVDQELVKRIFDEMPEMPSSKRSRLRNFGITEDHAAILLKRKEEDIVFSIAERGVAPTLAAVTMINSKPIAELYGNLCGDGRKAIFDNIVDALFDLTKLYLEDKLTRKQVRSIYGEIISTDKSYENILQAYINAEKSSIGEMEEALDNAILENKDAWVKYCAGEDKVAGAFVGIIMRETQGGADPQTIHKYLENKRYTKNSKL